MENNTTSLVMTIVFESEYVKEGGGKPRCFVDVHTANGDDFSEFFYKELEEYCKYMNRINILDFELIKNSASQNKAPDTFTLFSIRVIKTMIDGVWVYKALMIQEYKSEVANSLRDAFMRSFTTKSQEYGDYKNKYASKLERMKKEKTLSGEGKKEVLGSLKITKEAYEEGFFLSISTALLGKCEVTENILRYYEHAFEKLVKVAGGLEMKGEE